MGAKCSSRRTETEGSSRRTRRVGKGVQRRCFFPFSPYALRDEFPRNGSEFACSRLWRIDDRVDRGRRDENGKLATRQRGRKNGITFAVAWKRSRHGLSEMARAQWISRCVSYGRSLSLPFAPLFLVLSHLSPRSSLAQAAAFPASLASSSFTIYFFIERALCAACLYIPHW